MSQPPAPLSVPEKPKAAKRAAEEPATQPAAKKSKTKEKLPSAEQLRRPIWDAIKGKINVTKWTIKARTHCTVDMDMRAFDEVVKPNAAEITPATYDANAHVIVARLKGAQVGEAFGKSKVKGGSRMGTWTANCADVVFYPSKGKADIWWTMDGGSGW